MRFIGDGQPRSREHSQARFERIADDWEKVGYGLLAIERLSDQQFLGFAGLGNPEMLPQLLPSTEIGWRIRSDAWGSGYGTEAATAIVEWAFTDLGRRSILAIIRQDNKPSIRVAEKLNMVPKQQIMDSRYEQTLDVYELEASNWFDSAED